jgi:hypothetical protein
MSRTCVRVELPTKYNESERKRGRSKIAMYMEKGDDWIFVVDLLKEEKSK